jgi:flagellar biosynthetic protein FliR
MGELGFLAALPTLSFHAMLLFVRIGAAVMTMPGLGELELPSQVRLGIAVILTVLLLPVMEGNLPNEPSSPAELLRIIAMEAIIGIWMGLMAKFIAISLAVSGQFVALTIGLSNVIYPDPNMGGQTAVTSRFLGLLAAALILATGLYALPVRALVESYSLFPVGSGWPGDEGGKAMIEVISESLKIALRLASPFAVASVAFNVGVGLISRLAPQLQIYFIAAPAQIIGGLALFSILLPYMVSTWLGATRDLLFSLPGLR